MKVKIDLSKIFLTPPRTLFERITLFLMMVVIFMLFFSPLKFSNMNPIEAIITATLPTLSISWGWIVLLRSIFRKAEFVRKVE